MTISYQPSFPRNNHASPHTFHVTMANSFLYIACREDYRSRWQVYGLQAAPRPWGGRNFYKVWEIAASGVYFYSYNRLAVVTICLPTAKS
jgi:hypothetical protein